MKTFNQKPVILTIFENLEYQVRLGDVDATFIIYACNGSKKVNRKLPDNHMILHDLTPDIRPDIILSQNKKAHYGILKALSEKYNKPLFSLYHETPIRGDLDKLFGTYSEVDIFLSRDHSNSWECIDPTIIEPCGLEGKPQQKLYINRSYDFNCIYPILDSMASCACVVSPNVYEVNNIVKHMYNGVLYNKNYPEQEGEVVKKLLANEELLNILRQNSRRIIVENFSHASFTNKWNLLIKEYS